MPAASAELAQLDLGSLASVREFSAGFADSHERLDLLVNNAGVMAPPRRLTADGFESQIGTNHLGHFALTGLLLGSLRAAEAPRVVTVSSDAHRFGRIRFENLQGERHYNNWLAYSQSKLANLLFAFELQRRAVAAGSNLLSVAAHPGYAATNLQSAGPAGRFERLTMVVTNKLVAQSAEMGALPTLVRGGGRAAGRVVRWPERVHGAARPSPSRDRERGGRMTRTTHAGCGRCPRS